MLTQLLLERRGQTTVKGDLLLQDLLPWLREGALPEPEPPPASPERPPPDDQED
jgi:hypothetical protein